MDRKHAGHGRLAGLTMRVRDPVTVQVSKQLRRVSGTRRKVPKTCVVAFQELGLALHLTEFLPVIIPYFQHRFR
jgi:hypothetical protein